MTTTKSSKRKNRNKRQKIAEGSPMAASGTVGKQVSHPSPHNPLIFQDLMKRYCRRDDDDENDTDPSLAFFELANASCIRYRLSNNHDSRRKFSSQSTTTKLAAAATTTTKKRARTTTATNTTAVADRCVTIRQNSQAQTHTGGVVWETSYLLLEYLLSQHEHQSLGPKLLEVGAGCGLLGLVLAASQLPSLKEVVLTETQHVLDTVLLPNVQANNPVAGCCSSTKVSACVLDWTNYESDAAALPKFDVICGTDICFSQSLVEPLLATLGHMAHADTVVYLCVQSDRCPASFELLQSKAHAYNFTWEPIDLGTLALVEEEEQLSGNEMSSFVQWGQALECKLIRMRFLPKSNSTTPHQE